MVGLLLLSLLVSASAWPFSLHSESSACETADSCVVANCSTSSSPPCHCSGTETTVPKETRPQIVYLTFDDAFTAYAEEHFYRALFNGTYKNPDNCPIRATHFISAQYTDYSLMNEYRNMGHELASHSITHRTNQTYWTTMDEDGWKEEFVGMRKMIGQFANVPTEEVTGIRVPYLLAGGETQFGMMEKNGFSYDCSMPTQAYGYIDADRALYPYTLDYRSVQDCEVGTCPKCQYKGMWVQPMVDLEDNWFGANPNLPDYGMPCSMLDGCIGFNNNTAEEITSFLERNFNRVYKGNRAPWGLYMHAAWFYGEYETTHYAGYRKFLESLAEKEDVWIVPVRDGIEYMKNPQDITELTNAGKNSVLGCARYEEDDYKQDCGRRPISCRFGNVTNEDIHGQERYMKICQMTLGRSIQSCPETYPWLGNPCGGNSPCQD